MYALLCKSMYTLLLIALMSGSIYKLSLLPQLVQSLLLCLYLWLLVSLLTLLVPYIYVYLSLQSSLQFVLNNICYLWLLLRSAVIFIEFLLHFGYGLY